MAWFTRDPPTTAYLIGLADEEEFDFTESGWATVDKYSGDSY